MPKTSDAQDAEILSASSRKRGSTTQSKKKSLISQQDDDIIDITEISECEDCASPSAVAQKNNAPSAKKSPSHA